MQTQVISSVAWRQSGFNPFSALAGALFVLVVCLDRGMPAAERVLELSLDRPVPELLSQRAFRKTLEKPLFATWQDAEFRRILAGIREARKISVLRDRRLDPDRRLTVGATGESLGEFLDVLAGSHGARTSIVGNTVYLGPPAAARKLRTLVELRWNELFDESFGVARNRRFDLGEHSTLHWNDLDQPAAIVQRWCARFDLKVEGLDRLPHDLWGTGTLPQVNLVEGLSLILIQFDVTFAWKDGARTIELVPVPREIGIERRYTVRGMTPQRAAELWQQTITGLATRVEETEVVVTGTVEQHEAVDRLLNRRKVTEKPKPSGRSPLAKRRFQLTVKVPAQAIMNHLEKQEGVKFVYDPVALKSAGIDLTQRVEVDLKEATIEELLHAVFDSLRVRFEVRAPLIYLELEPAKE